MHVSPETYLGALAWTSDVREVVDRFYAAARAGDRAAIEELVSERFAASAVVPELPAGLSVGDVIEAAGSGDHVDNVVVELRDAREPQAVAWWRFENFRVTEIRTFYLR